MRRRIYALAWGSVTLLALVCGGMATRAWQAEGYELVLPGASDLRIERSGLAHIHIRYLLPAGQTTHDLTLFLKQQGWQRITFPNIDRTTLSFSRPGWPNQIREIMIVTIDPLERRRADLQFGRCLRFAGVYCF